MVGNLDIFWLWGRQVIKLRERFVLGDWRGGENYGVRLQGPRVNTWIIWKFKLAWLFVFFTWRFHCFFNIEQLFLIMRWFFSGFPIVGARGAAPILQFFSNPLLPPYSRQLYYQMTPSQVFLPAFYALPMLPPCFDLIPLPPHQILRSPLCLQHHWETLLLVVKRAVR